MSKQQDPLEHVLRNRAAWNIEARDDAEPGRRAWREWGIWRISESGVRLIGGFPKRHDYRITAPRRAAYPPAAEARSY